MQPITKHGFHRDGDRWRVWWYDSSGKRCRAELAKCNRYTPKKQVREVAAAFIQNLAFAGGGKDGPALSVWLAKYRAMRQHELRPTTLDNIDRASCLLVEHFGERREIGTIKRADAAGWRSSLQRPRTLAGGVEAVLSPSTVAKHVMWAKHIFRTAFEQDEIAFSPFDRLSSGQPKTDQQWRYISLEDTAKIIAACPTPQWRAAFALARHAGLRRNEIEGLRWADIDLDGRILTIHAGSTTRTTKKRLRLCPVSPALAAILAVVREAAPGSPGPWSGATGVEITKGAGSIVAASGVPVYAKPLHTLRKSLETDWIDQHSIADVCEWLGNSPAVALAHYKRAKPESFARVSGVSPAPNLPQAAPSTGEK